MTIFVHIGLNKTGSSSIQRFCHLHRDILRERGLVYPDVGTHDSAHYGVSNLLIGQPSEVDLPDADALKNVIRSAASSNTNVLLSSEYLSQATNEEVSRVKAFLTAFDADKKIIVYLRRHDLWIPSLFNEALKTIPTYKPWHSDIRDYTIHLLGNKPFEIRYPAILDRWAAQFGAANIIVRPFESAQFKMGEYLWDFLGSMDSNLPGLLQEKGIQPLRVNESLPEHLLRTIGYVKSSSLSGDVKNRITSLLLQSGTSFEAPRSLYRAWDSRAFALAPYHRRAIVKCFSDDYQYIATRYMGSADGLLFRDPVD
jgi:hypothetical protein